MTKEEKSKKVLQAEEKLKQAQANLNRAKKEERRKLKKVQDHHKFMMGGVVAKWFPEAFDFSEQEINRIIACAFKNRDVQNMIRVVVSERPVSEEETEVAVDEDEITENKNIDVEKV
ncbi:MAG: hypothetical protein IKQ44_08590 [Lachnospiraceae bacterium]|nr:hypothetical protein [Lachnospiraceae bacterium]